MNFLYLNFYFKQWKTYRKPGTVWQLANVYFFIAINMQKSSSAKNKIWAIIIVIWVLFYKHAFVHLGINLLASMFTANINLIITMLETIRTNAEIE